MPIDPRHSPSHRPNRRASVKDVAKAAGVSLGTVSNVMNHPHLVAEATRKRVDAAIAELDFVRNESARSLRAGRSRTLAYVMLDAGNPFFTDVAKGIEQAAEEAGFSVFLCNSDGRSEREAAYLELLVEQRVHGILITPVDPNDPRLLAAVEQGTSLVVVDHTADNQELCSVAVDDKLGGRLAIEHLIDVGYRRIALVGGPRSLGQVRDRFDGAREAFSAAGLDPDDLIQIETDALSVAQGRAAGERLTGLPTARRPDAAFCANDLLALGLLQQSIGTGRRVPDDLAIVGYDDIDFASAAAVPLTSVRQPREQLGRRATQLLLDEHEHSDHEHECVMFEPELTARASTRPA